MLTICQCTKVMHAPTQQWPYLAILSHHFTPPHPLHFRWSHTWPHHWKLPVSPSLHTEQSTHTHTHTHISWWAWRPSRLVQQYAPPLGPLWEIGTAVPAGAAGLGGTRSSTTESRSACTWSEDRQKDKHRGYCDTASPSVCVQVLAQEIEMKLQWTQDKLDVHPVWYNFSTMDFHACNGTRVNYVRLIG